MSELTTVFIGLLSGIVGATVKSSIEDKKRYESNIIKERKEWRDKIRELTEELNTTNLKKNQKIDYQRIKAGFQTRLNPYKEDEEEDKEIIICLDKLIKEKNPRKFDRYLNEFNERISYLLKHDWERVKYESSKNYLFPERVGLFIAFISSVVIQILFKCIFIKFETLIFIKRLIGMDLLFYTFTTLFTMACLVIIYRLKMVICPPIKECEILIDKFLKKPQRREYKK